MNDRIRELGFFLRVSEEASFSAAARSLDLDPSTISKVIQRLENRLAVRLFHRTSRVLQLTQEGEQFLAAAQKVMQALEEAEASVSTAVTEATGVLRISSTAAFARRRLAPLLPAFLQANPLVRVEVIVAATPPDLFEQQIDISFQSGNIPDSTLVARRASRPRLSGTRGRADDRRLIGPVLNPIRLPGSGPLGKVPMQTPTVTLNIVRMHTITGADGSPHAKHERFRCSA